MKARSENACTHHSNEQSAQPLGQAGLAYSGLRPLPASPLPQTLAVMPKETVALLSLGVILLTATAVGCAHESAHENFNRIMNGQVGKSASDPTTDIGRYWSNRIGETKLSNGNTEIGFRHSRECRYFFQIDKTTNKIVAWRFEGTEDTCEIPQ